MFLKPPSAVAAVAPARLASPQLWLVALVLLAALALYWPTAASIISVWNSSETFAHGYIILPISLWLIWRRRANFAAYPPTPWWPGIGLLALAGAAWLLARLGEVQFALQYSFVAMLPLIALALLGRRLAGSLAFPLLFVLLAVPFGEVFIDPLIHFTADFTVRALQLTGIPVLRNGTRFEIPSGSWSVVTACSGVRYLISSVTIGLLYAYLTYRSTRRRVLFVALAVVVPIIANGLRAYMIVMIGHLSNMTLATGVDHLIYGWLFFGLVMLVMFMIGNFWAEDELPPAVTAPGVARWDAERPLRPAVVATLATFAMVALWPLLAHLIERGNVNPAPVRLEIALRSPPAPSFAPWVPNFMPADARYRAVTRADPAAAPVVLDVLYYRNQTRLKSVISSVNTLTGEKDDYHELGAALRSEQLDGAALQVRETRLAGSAGPLLVWQWYWIDQQRTASAMRGKLLQARAALLLHGDDGAAVMLAAPYTDDPAQARAALRAFVQRDGAAIEAALAAARRH